MAAAPAVRCGGKLYRQCAVAVVFNPAKQVLIGERKGKPGNWQFAQGGVDLGESPVDAAKRELFEEMGLEANKGGLEFVAALEPDEQTAYDVDFGWLKEEGFAGQQLAFSLFYLPETGDPSRLCSLEGLGGEPAEFTAVRWAPLSEVVEGIWEVKRKPYERCQELAGETIERFLEGKR
mmetsp:Transcript_7418/g.24640  ORF Transcript_7418/g.24640 Transcript_7418/m.24640 type:complete len:178 (+) Transcript_7418:6-539(+)